MKNKDRNNIEVFDNIPEWAIYALEYGVDEDGSLNDEDVNQINQFVDENFPNGYLFSVRWDEKTEFDPFPAFGLPCSTYTVDFVRL